MPSSKIVCSISSTSVLIAPGIASGPALALQLDGRLGPEVLSLRARALGVDTLRVVSEIPLDARHNAKVDYPRLREMLWSGARFE